MTKSDFWCIFWLLCLYSEVLRNLFSLFTVSEFKIRGIWHQFILILYIKVVQLFRECEESVSNGCIFSGRHANHFDRKTCNQHLLLHQFYSTNDYCLFSFYMPLTRLFQLKSDRCPTHLLNVPKIKRIQWNKIWRVLYFKFLLIVIHWYTFSIHTNSSLSNSSLCYLHFQLHILSNTLFTLQTLL